MQQLASQLERVPARGRGDLVEEALCHKAVVRHAHRAPRPPRHRRQLQRELVHEEVGDRVGQVDRAIHEAVVDALLQRSEFESQRRAGDAVRPGDQPPGSVEPRAEPVVARGPVKPVAHVVLARPDDFHRRSDGLGHSHRLGDEVRLEPPPESAPREGRVNADLLFRQSGDGGRHALSVALILRRSPHIASVGPDERRAAHRLHSGMVHEWYVVLGEDAGRRGGDGPDPIADALRHHARTLGESDQLGTEARGIERGRLAFVPLDCEGAPRLDRLPIRIRHDGDAGGAPGRPAAALGAHPRARLEFHNLAHPGHRLRALGVDPLHPTTQHR